MGVQFTDAELDTVQKPGVGHLVHLLALQNATALTLQFQDVCCFAAGFVVKCANCIPL